MAAQLQFRDVTLGYDRHPAVHHLNGEVASGALVAVVGPNGAGKSTLFRGIVGILKPLSGSIVRGDLDVRDIAYLPQTADIDRSFPISVFDFVGTGLWRSTGFFGGMGNRARATRSRRRSRPSASTASRTARSARCPAARCSACCLRGCCCRTRPDRARRTVQRHRRQDVGRSAGAGAALACRAAHGAGGAARHRSGARQFPRNPAARARPGRLGRHRRGADTRKIFWQARRMCEAFDDSAAACAVDDLPSRAA